MNSPAEQIIRRIKANQPNTGTSDSTLKLPPELAVNHSSALSADAQRLLQASIVDGRSKSMAALTLPGAKAKA